MKFAAPRLGEDDSLLRLVAHDELSARAVVPVVSGERRARRTGGDDDDGVVTVMLSHLPVLTEDMR